MSYLERNKDIFLSPNDNENKQYSSSLQLINEFNDKVIQEYIVKKIKRKT